MGKCPVSAKDVRPVFVGEKVPEGVKVRGDGGVVDLAEAFRGKPYIAVFYRGGW